MKGGMLESRVLSQRSKLEEVEFKIDGCTAIGTVAAGTL